MRYGLILDKDNYLIGFCHYGDDRDIVEIPNEVKFSSNINYWKFENGTFTYDEAKEKADEKSKREADNREKYLSNLIEDEKGNLYKTEAINGTNTLVLVEDNGGKLYL